MTGFSSMTTAQAGAYLQQFLAEAPESLARLDGLVRAAGGAPVSADPSPASLDRAWAGARPVLAWAPGYVPPPLGAPAPPPDRRRRRLPVRPQVKMQAGSPALPVSVNPSSWA